MMTITPETPGTLPISGPIGRTVRLLAGIVLLFSSATVLVSYASYVGLGVPDNTWWLGSALSLFLLPRLVNVGFGRSWGRWPQAVVLLLAVVAVAFDLLRYGIFWGPPLGLLVYLLLVVVLGYFGLSFVLAAIFAVSGCEVRAVPNLLARLSGRETAEHHCPT
jgi:hypothetical protein